MKFNEIFESRILIEGINFGQMQQEVYAYVLPKMKKLNPEMHDSYAAELARTTDQFWVHEFDEVHRAFKRATTVDELLEPLAIAIEAVSNSIIDFFADAMNHPTGYSARKLKGLSIDTPTDKELITLINKIDPTLLKDLQKTEKEAAEKQKAIQAEQKKSITPERMEELASWVKEYEEAGWKTFFKYIKKPHPKGETISSYFPKGTTDEQIASIDSVKALKEFFLKNADEKLYCLSMYENLMNIKDFGYSGSIEFSTLSIIARDAALSKKFYKLITR